MEKSYLKNIQNLFKKATSAGLTMRYIGECKRIDGSLTVVINTPRGKKLWACLVDGFSNSDFHEGVGAITAYSTLMAKD